MGRYLVNESDDEPYNTEEPVVFDPRNTEPKSADTQYAAQHDTLAAHAVGHVGHEDSPEHHSDHHDGLTRADFPGIVAHRVPLQCHEVPRAMNCEEGPAPDHLYPADTWHKHNVIITSKRRRDVVLTL